MIKMSKSVRKFYLLRAITKVEVITGTISLIFGAIFINCSSPLDYIGLILLLIGTISVFIAGLAEISNPFDELNNFLKWESQQETKKRIKKYRKWLI